MSMLRDMVIEASREHPDLTASGIAEIVSRIARYHVTRNMVIGYWQRAKAKGDTVPQAKAPARPDAPRKRRAKARPEVVAHEPAALAAAAPEPVVRSITEADVLAASGINLAPEPEPVEAAAPRARVQVMDVRPGECRFIDAKGPLGPGDDWTYCAAPTPIGSAWCGHHQRTVYTKISDGPRKCEGFKVKAGRLTMLAMPDQGVGR